MKLKPLCSNYYWVLLALLGIFSVWIRMTFPVFAIGPASFDDALFVHQAAEIGMGHWLGEYGNLTHSKGVGYAIFLLLNYAIGLPLKFTEHVLFLIVAGFFSITVGKLYRSRNFAVVIFIFLSFSPAAWTAEAGGRVVREGLYISQALMLMALGIHCWILDDARALKEGIRLRWKVLVLFGAVSGWFWLTREEGVWLVPAMLVLVFYWIFRQYRLQASLTSILGCLAIPLVVAFLLISAVNLINYAVYGVYRNNDFRSSDYQAGYGALTRIKHDHWQRYVLFPKDARERAYSISAAARELQPYFEGAGGEFWRRAGCDQTHTSPCPEILSGWFMWALRDAVAGAGYYKNAKDAQSFYRRLAQEVDQGCRMNEGMCLPERVSLLPPWQSSYAADTLNASWTVFKTLANFGGVQPYIQASVGDAKQLALFDIVTNGPLARYDGVNGAWAPYGLHSPRDGLRMKLANAFYVVISKISGYGLPMVLIFWFLWSIFELFKWMRDRRMPDPFWWLASALAAAVFTRVILLGFLEATAIPSNNMLYLFPVTPFSLAIIPVVAYSLLRKLPRSAAV